MSEVIRTNMSALRTYNLLNTNQSHAQKHMLKVSTGLKLNSAKDDASVYSISERMRVRIRALDQAHQNTQNGSSMIKTAEGAVSNILETLRTLKEKAIDAANDSNTDEDRRIMQKEFNQFVDQIDDDALVQFNSMYLIDNSRNNARVTTYSVMHNDNLSRDLYFPTASFKSMKTRTGESLGINDNDKVVFSYVSNAKRTQFELTGNDSFFTAWRKSWATDVDQPLAFAFSTSSTNDGVRYGWHDKFNRGIFATICVTNNWEKKLTCITSLILAREVINKKPPVGMPALLTRISMIRFSFCKPLKAFLMLSSEIKSK